MFLNKRQTCARINCGKRLIPLFITRYNPLSLAIGSGNQPEKKLRRYQG
ncbi:MAG: hypothetical protein JWL90_3387 [Chthoniobacteraceae bacterium]|nr:hypothetical protein [Chthoniobacteraceae bacterium]